PLPVPATLLPKTPPEPERCRAEQPVSRGIGLSRYGEAALDKAARAIIGAPDGQQGATINSECFSIGTLAGAGGVPRALHREVLLWAAQQMRDHDPKRPWRLDKIEFKVARAFADGLRHPRDGRHAA